MSALRSTLEPLRGADPRRWLPERALRPLSLVAGAIAVLAVAAVVARVAASHYGSTAIEALVGVPLLVAVARRPALAMLVLLGVVSSIFAYGSLPRVNLPGHPPINVADVLLATIVGGTVVRQPWRRWPVEARRYALALLGFLALITVATVKTAMLGHQPGRAALYNYRNFLYLSAALTVCVEMRRELWKPLLNAGMVLAAVISVLSIGAALSSSVAHVLANLTPWSIQSAAQSFGAPTALARARGCVCQASTTCTAWPSRPLPSPSP